MVITDVRIRLRDKDPVKAFAMITFDNAFVVRGISIVEEKHGLVVEMPARIRSDGSLNVVMHATTWAMQEEIERAVLRAYHEARGNADGEDCAGRHAPLVPEPPRRGGTAARELWPYSEPDSPTENDICSDRPPAHP